MRELHFDPLETELGDIDVFETITGGKFEDFDWNGAQGASGMKAIYYLVMRQNDPDFTADKLAKVKLRDLVEVADAVKDARPDPTDGEEEV